MARRVSVRLARALNKVMGRTGKVFKDRYHARVLTTPRQVRNALAYVLCNARKHAVPLPHRGLDPCSSAAVFGAWRGAVVTSTHPLAQVAASVAIEATTWLLRVGWRRAGGPLDPTTVRAHRSLRTGRCLAGGRQLAAGAPRDSEPNGGSVDLGTDASGLSIAS